MSRTTTDQLVAVVAELSKLDQRGKEFVLEWLTREVEKMRAKKAKAVKQAAEEDVQP